MDIHTATEQAYKNGYKKGYEDAVKEFAERLKERSCVRYMHTKAYQILIEEKGDFDNLVKEMAAGGGKC